MSQYPLILRYAKSDGLIDPRNISVNQLNAVYYNGTMNVLDDLVVEINIPTHDHYYVLGFSNNYNVIVAPDSVIFDVNLTQLSVETLFLKLTNDLRDINGESNTNMVRPIVTPINTFKRSPIYPAHITFARVRLIEITKINEELSGFAKLKFREDKRDAASVLVSISELNAPPVYFSIIL